MAPNYPFREYFTKPIAMQEENTRSGSGAIVQDAFALGVVIRQARKDHGLTQSQLAGLAGAGVRFVSELERGKPGAEVGKVLEVLAVLGLRLRVTG